MGEKFTYDPQGNLLLSFPNFEEWMRFCRLCVEKDLLVVKDTETMSAMISSEVFERLPKNLRDDFKIQDPETTQKLLEARKKPTRVRRRPPPTTDQQPADEQKLIDTLLPVALMPRTE